DELIDRFGDYPVEVDHLFTVSILKMHAKRERVESIRVKNKKVELLVEEDRSQEIDGSKLFELANTFGRDVQLGTDNNKLKVTFKGAKEIADHQYETVNLLLSVPNKLKVTFKGAKEIADHQYETVINFIKKLADMNRTG